MNILRIVFACVILHCGIYSHGQRAKQGFELMEIVKISETYRQAPYLSFNIEYTFSDSSYSDNILEQMSGSSKISQGNYWTMLDSNEFVQGYQYSLTILHHDSIIAVDERQEYGKMTQLPLLDSVFRKANIDSIVVSHYNDSTYKLMAYFNPDASYSKYVIEYDKNNYLIRRMSFYIKEQVINEEVAGTALVEIIFSNYSEVAIDPSIFKEDRFIYKSNGEFFGKEAFAGFKIIDNTQK